MVRATCIAVSLLLFTVGPATGQVASGARPDSVTGVGLRGQICYAPEMVGQMYLPPPAPKALRGVEFTLRVFVTATGKVDSIRIAGLADTVYKAKVRQQVAKWQWPPRRMENGCPVASWIGFTFTL